MATGPSKWCRSGSLSTCHAAGRTTRAVRAATGRKPSESLCACRAATTSSATARPRTAGSSLTR
eukprot:3386694-Lingulodinium_polyedra.AAC.1